MGAPNALSGPHGSWDDAEGTLRPDAREPLWGRWSARTVLGTAERNSRRQRPHGQASPTVAGSVLNDRAVYVRQRPTFPDTTPERTPPLRQCADLVHQMVEEDPTIHLN
jgi:hypothetical protein